LVCVWCSGATILHEGYCFPGPQQPPQGVPIDETLYPPDNNIVVDPPVILPTLVPLPEYFTVKKSYKKMEKILP